MAGVVGDVLNKRDLGKQLPENAVYCGRPSPWGNPYRIGVDGTRDEVIRKYRVWLWRTLREQPDFLAPLIGKDLVCWCAPSPCHCDVLAKAIAWKYRNLASIL